MKTTCLASYLFAAEVLCCLDLQAADAPSTAVGHWEGAITLPTTALNIRVDLARQSDVWQGTIDIPAQGLQGFKLEPVNVDGAAVTFAMPGVPGNPQFTGRVAVDGNNITGNSSQATGAFPFKLERKTQVAQQGETPVVGIPGKGLEGYWQGALKVTPAIELRSALEITGVLSLRRATMRRRRPRPYACARWFRPALDRSSPAT